MRIVSNLLPELIRFRSFRLLMAKTYPLLKKSGILGLLQKLNNGSLSDPYDHIQAEKNGLFRTYDLENFDPSDALKKYSINPEEFIKSKIKYKIGLLVDSGNEYFYLETSCKILDLKYEVFDIKDPFVIEKLSNTDCAGIVIFPYSNSVVLSAFQDVARIITTETPLKIYPSIREISFYESKRALASFLKINNIPHPATWVFYDFARAREFLETTSYPIIFKTSAGASASGVEILSNKREAMKLAKQLFYKYYLRKLEADSREIFWGCMLLQEFVKEAKEFRVIKAGDSWFGYQKWKEPNQAFLSGSGLCRYSVYPTERLLDFCRDLAEKYQFTTMCFDIFETTHGEYLVNELQTWFGSYDPSEMYVDNIPGRFRFIDGKWIFEPGFYNVYGTNLLRISHFVSLIYEDIHKEVCDKITKTPAEIVL